MNYFSCSIEYQRSHAVSKISVVIVVRDGIIFHVVLKISPITVVTGEVIFYVLYVVSTISVVRVVSDEVIPGIQNQRS